MLILGAIRSALNMNITTLCSAVLKNAFHAFANEREKIVTEDIGTILEMLGHRLDDKALKEAVKEVDTKDQGEIDFEPFACFAGRFVEVEEDAEAVAKELRETFLLYDRECMAKPSFATLCRLTINLCMRSFRNSIAAKGYITVAVLRQILLEIDDKIPPGDLDLMIEEIDADGSGTVDFQGRPIRIPTTVGNY